MTIYLVRVVRRSIRRHPVDWRRKCFSVLASYRSRPGNEEYRKEFLFPVDWDSTWAPPFEYDLSIPMRDQIPGVTL